MLRHVPFPAKADTCKKSSFVESAFSLLGDINTQNPWIEIKKETENALQWELISWKTFIIGLTTMVDCRSGGYGHFRNVEPRYRRKAGQQARDPVF